MNPKDAPNNLAIIGASGTGKTTLAVGLYATSTKTFTVSPIGDETRRYLEIRKTSIEEGFWPAATNESENFDLRIRLHAVGRQTDIVFRDYMGERMEKDPNYLKEVIGKPKSAMILFNPGMPGGTCKKAAEAFRSISKPLENSKGAAEGGFDPRIVAEQIKNIKSSLNRLVFLNDKKGESSRDELVSECDSTSSELEAWGRSAESVSDSEFERMANRLQSMASRIDVLKPIGLAEPEPRNRMIGNLKKIAQHLKDNGCIAVAFVVTATDRLASDLAGFREDFESYAAEITNHLTNLGLKWKRFEVTVSGPLDDQNKPKLARGENNTTHEPFLWLLDCIKRDASRKRVKAAAATAAAALAIAGATFGGLLWQSRAALDKAEKELAACLAALDKAYAVSDESAVRTNAAFLTNDFGRIRTYLPSDRKRKDALSKRKDAQSDLWGVRLLAMEFASQTNSLSSAPMDVPLDWFDAFDKRLGSFSPAFAVAIAERDALGRSWSESRHSLETCCQAGHFRATAEKESRNLAAAKPEALVAPLKASLDLITNKDGKYFLLTNREELSVQMMAARTNAIARYIDSKTDWNPTDDNPPADAKDIVQLIRRDLKSALTSDEFASLETAIGQRRAKARLAWEKHQFPLRRRAQLDELKATSDSPATALKGSLVFLNGMDGLFPSIADVDRLSARTAITNERAAAIARYIDAKAEWKPEDDDPPGKIAGLHRQARTELKGALTDAEFASLSTALEARCTNARKSWDAYHFPRRSGELESSLKDPYTVSAVNALKNSLSFLAAMTNDYPTISQPDFIRTRTAIESARKTALANYADSIAKKWDVKGRKPPEFDAKNLRETVLTDAVVTDDEAADFGRDIQKRFAKAKDGWTENQKELCDSFIRRWLSSMVDVAGSLNAYMEFRMENSGNPSIGSVDRKMVELLKNRLAWLVDEYNREFRAENAVWDIESNRSARMQKAQNEFNELKRLCFAITNPMLDGTPVQHSWASKFALLCIEKGRLKESGINSAFQQRFEMTKIQVKVDFKSTCVTFIGLSMGAEIRSRYWQDGAKNSMAETLVDVGARNWTVTEAHSGKWYELWNGSRSFILNPWTDSYFSIYWEDRVDPGFNVSGHFSGNIWSEFRNNKEYRDGYLEYVDSFHGEHVGQDTEGTITVRLYGRFTGVDLSMLLQQSQQ